MKNSVEFERCADFLARMIEKYGNEICLPNTTEDKNAYENHTDDSDDDKISLFPDAASCA